MLVKKFALGAFFALICGALVADETWYVDNSLGKLDAGGNETYDGKSATVSGGHGPYFKIQNALDQASAGATVKIAAGVYGDEQDYTARDASYDAMRLVISKSVTLEGAGREKTFVKGALDTAKGVEKGYCGANSVGGILIKSGAGDTLIKSLTVCTCSQSLRSDLTRADGGKGGIGIEYAGTMSKSMAGKPWVVDCVVSNIFHCNTVLCNVNLARTLVAYTHGIRHSDNTACTSLTFGGGGGTYLNAIHSVFHHLSDVPRGIARDYYMIGNATPLALGDCGSIVNCTFARNMNAVSPSTICVDAILNSVVMEHYGNSAIRATSISNCVLQSSKSVVKTTDDAHQGENLYSQSGALAAPLLMDFRAVATTGTVQPGSCVVGKGNSAYLNLFPEAYRWTDFYGESFSADANGKVCAGCSQKPIEAVSAFRTTKSVTVDGIPSYCEHRASEAAGWVHIATNDWPRVFELDWDRVAYPTQTDVFQYEVDDGSMVKMPNMSGKALFVPRRDARDGRVEAMFPNATYYVDATTGAEGAAGTAAAPVKRIQAAVDKASTTYGQRTLVKVAPGDYTDHVCRNGDADFCVAFYSTGQNALIGVRSTAGAATTRIVGAKATGEFADKYGYGTNAVRCVFVGACTNSFIQGFTIMNGYCSKTNDDYAAAVHCGKGIGSYPFFSVADCVITNCHGSAGGVLRGVRAVRCKIVENHNYRLGMIYNCHLVNSLVDGVYDDYPASGKNNVLVTATIQGSTLIGRDANSMVLPSAHDFFFDSVVVDTRKFNSNRTSLYYGMVFGDGAGDGDGYGKKFPEGVCRKTVSGDPGFVSKAARDYRLVTASPAIGWDSWAKLPGYEADPIVSDASYSVSATRARDSYYDNITYDLDGNKPVALKGKGVAGCYQRPYGVRVTLSLPDGVTVTGLGDGSVVPLGSTVHVSLSSSARTLTSVTVNGVAVDPAGFDLTAPAYDPNTTDWQDLTFDIAASCVWYVDAVNGNDTENNGWSEATAFKTLKRALGADSNVVSNDTVVALPGTYAYTDGTMTPPIGTLKTVAVVPAGVKLVSRDGWKSTTIEGKVGDDFWFASTGEAARGEDDANVRCVFLGENATLEGFRIRHGGTLKATSSSWDKRGGGVASTAANYEPRGQQTPTPQTFVRNCRIELCCAACFRGVYEQCTIISNINSTGGNVLNNAQSLYGCVIARNRGENAVEQPRETVGCTFSDNWILNGGNVIGRCYPCDTEMAVRPFVNCIFHETTASSTSNALKFAYNCIVPRANYFWTHYTKAQDPTYTDPVWTNLTVAAVELDADFRPVNLSAPCVDAVTNEYAAWEVTVPPASATNDLTGGQRVYNGVQDIGAVEADWRARYAAAIINRNLTVPAASPETIENADGKVELKAGTLALSWRNTHNVDATMATMSFEVKGNGTLTLAIDGTAVKTYKKVGGAVTYPLTLAKKSATAITFTYEPADGDTAGAVIGPFACPYGMVILIK